MINHPEMLVARACLTSAMSIVLVLCLSQMATAQGTIAATGSITTLPSDALTISSIAPKAGGDTGSVTMVRAGQLFVALLGHQTTSGWDRHHEDPHPTITRYRRVTERRLTRRVCEFEFRAALHNNDGATILGATATLIRWPRAVTIVDRTLTFGPVIADGTTWSSDTFAIRQGCEDRNDSDDLLEDLRWTIQVLRPSVTDLEPAHLTIAANGGFGTLTITIQNPNPFKATHVLLTSGDPKRAAVPAEVLVASGATIGSFTVTGGAPGGPVPIIATLNGSSARAEITVRERPRAPTLTEPLVEGNVIVTGTGMSFAQVDVQVDGVAAGTGTVSTDGRFDVAVPALHAGQSVTAMQSVGGLTSPRSSPVIVRARPPAPVVTSPLLAGSTDIQGTGVPGATIDLFVNGVVVATGFVTTQGTFQVTVPGLAAGQHVTATQTVAGVTSIASAAVTVVSVPPPPSVNGPLVEGGATLTGTGALGATVEASVDGSSAGTASVSATGAWTLALAGSLVAGQQVSARQSVGGITSAFSPPLIVVARPPAPTVNTPLVEGSVTIGGTGVTDATVEVLLNGQSIGRTSVGGSGAWLLALDVPLVAGQIVTANQTVGELQSRLSPLTTVVARPPAPIVNGPLVEGSTTVAGRGTAGATLALFVAGSPAGSTTVSDTTTWTVVLVSPLAAGQPVTARQTLAGVDSDFSASLTVMPRPPAPTVNAPLFHGGTTITGTGVFGASVEVFVDGTSIGTTAVGEDQKWALPLASPLVGGRVITARQTVAGIPSALSASVTVQPALILIDITPAPTATLTQGGTLQFTSRGTFSDGSVQNPLVGVTWSSDSTAASISDTGVATGQTAGMAKILAIQGDIQATATALTVKPFVVVVTAPIFVAATTVSGTGAEPAAAVQVFVNGSAHGAAATADASGQWTAAGLAALVAGDSVTARQIVNGVTSDHSAAVIVGPAVLKEITISPTPSAVITKGQTFQFVARGTFSDGSIEDPLAGVIWSSDSAAALVSEAGLATGQSPGIANIRAAKSNIESNSTAVTVKPLPPAITGPLTVGATAVPGTGAEPGATVQVFVNGLPRGPSAIASAVGQWSAAGIAPALAAGDSVSAQQTTNGVQSDFAPSVIVGTAPPPPTPNQITDALTTQSVAVNLFSPDADPAASLSVLKQMPSVIDAGLSPDATTIWVEYAGGIGGLISRFPPDTFGSSVINDKGQPDFAVPAAISSVASSSSALFPQNDNYLGLYPFADSASNNSPIVSALVSAACSGPTFTTLTNQQVVVDTFAALSGYGVINVVTHGFQNRFGEPVVATREVATPATIILHLGDVQADATGHRALLINSIPGDPNPYFAIAPLFLDRHYQPGSLAGAAVFLTGCESLANNALADAFFRAGAHVFLGWDKAPTQTFASNTMVDLFTKLTNPVPPDLRTIQKALAQITTTDPTPFRSHATLRAVGFDTMAICSPVYAHLNPFGSRSFSEGPFSVEVLDNDLTPHSTSRDVTVTLRRRVISACRGVIFDSNRTVVVQHDQMSTTFDFTAGRDPSCNTQPITTELTITQIQFDPGKPLDLSAVPPQELVLTVKR